MDAEEHIKAGQLDEALAVAQEAVRKTPAEARPRVLLFQFVQRVRAVGAFRGVMAGKMQFLEHKGFIRATLAPTAGAVARKLPQGAYELIFLAALCLAFAACSSTQQAHSVADQQLRDFWSEFRAAAMAEDIARLEKLTAFPFETRGTLDTKPARTYDRAGFRSLVPRILDQDSGMTARGESMKNLFARSEKAPSAAVGTLRFGTFEFRKTLDGWRFVRAYLED